MDQTPVQKRKPHQRDYLSVVIKDGSSGYEKITHTEDFYKKDMPYANVKKLFLLEEIGSNFRGRVFHAMNKNGNLCVLKFIVRGAEMALKTGKRQILSVDQVAERIVSNWNLANKGVVPMARCGDWGHYVAVVMPLIDLIKPSDDMTALKLLNVTMKSQFHKKNGWHNDPAWRSVGVKRNETKNLKLVFMIGLEPGMMITKEQDQWNDSFDRMWGPFEKALIADWNQFVTRMR